MVKFWSVVTLGICAYIIIGNITGWYLDDVTTQFGWGLGLLYSLIQIDLAKLEKANHKRDLQIGMLNLREKQRNNE